MYNEEDDIDIAILILQLMKVRQRQNRPIQYEQARAIVLELVKNEE